MTIGASIFLIALGAILSFAVEFDLAGVDINTIGIILMIAGVVGLIIALFMYFNDTRGPSRGDDRVVEEERVRRER